MHQMWVFETLIFTFSTLYSKVLCSYVLRYTRPRLQHLRQFSFSYLQTHFLRTYIHSSTPRIPKVLSRFWCFLPLCSYYEFLKTMSLITKRGFTMDWKSQACICLHTQNYVSAPNSCWFSWDAPALQIACYSGPSAGEHHEALLIQPRNEILLSCL